MEYVQVAEDENLDAVELPTEEDGTLLQTTLQAQYPGSTGLKFRSPETNAVRGIRLNNGRYFAPCSDGWGDQVYFCVFPKDIKRKMEENHSKPLSKTKRLESQGMDLIVLNLLFSTTDESLRKYFEDFGEVLMAETKKHKDTGNSRGYGFVRFADIEVQNRVLATRHLIDGRWCEVKIPNSKQGVGKQEACKVYVGRITEDITENDLREYFSEFGTVTEVFLPKPFRSFGFVTFVDSEVAKSLFGEYHVIKGTSCFVANAEPKTEKNKQNNGDGNQNQGNRYGRGRNDDNSSNQSNGGNITVDPMKLMQLLQQACSSPQNNFSGNQSTSQPWQNGGGWGNHNQGGNNVPNLQSLGLNQPNQNNMNQIAMNPNVLAAALSQLGAFSNMQNQPKPQNQNDSFDRDGGQNRQKNRNFAVENTGFKKY